jgi:Ran GTPase-activating protein (RanGAP) involved in mRNA processing and transport
MVLTTHTAHYCHSSSITSCLMVNRNITMLELNGFPLTEKALYFLNKGLEHNQSITHLALARTAIGDDGVAELAHGIRVHPALSIINLSACKLTAKSASILADILKVKFFNKPPAERQRVLTVQPNISKSQAIQRQSEQWATTLRIHKKKDLERLKLSSSTTPVATATSVGVIYKNTLKRINLSCNLLGNDGCEVFVDALKEEIGLRGKKKKIPLPTEES